MRNDQSRTLFAYWDALRAGRPAPDRTEIDPGAIAPVLGDTFILEGQGTPALAYRLAGSRVCAIFAREMKGVSFLDGFTMEDRRKVLRGLADAHAAQAGLMLALTCHNTAGQEVVLEAVILPLTHRGRMGARMIGALGGADMPYWIGRDGIVSMEVTSVRLLWPTWRGAEERETPKTAPPAAAFATRPALRLIHGGNAA
jgi:hypothetical protein